MQDQAHKDCVDTLNNVIDDIVELGEEAVNDSDTIQALADYVLPVLLRDVAVDEPSNLEYPDVENWLNGMPVAIDDDEDMEILVNAILAL